MIRTITSTLPTFKTLTFGTGLNIVLADVAAESTDRHTRNSAGKTSLVEVIHFLLGSDASKKSLFKHPDLVGHSFLVELFLADRWMKVRRTGSNDGVVYLATGDARALGLETPLDILAEETDEVPITLDAWRAVLGWLWFGLPQVRTDTPFARKWSPTFRSLVGYFARRRTSGGLDIIEKSAGDQQPGSWQVAVSYLLGLDWTVAREFQDMRDRKRAVEALTKAIKQGELGAIFGTTAEIRPELARAEAKRDAIRAQIDAFLVHDSYRELAARAAELKEKVGDATFGLAEADAAVDYMLRSLEHEAPPAYSDVERLYAEAGVDLPTVALRRFEDVKAFQASVASNRRRYLEAQIQEVRDHRAELERALLQASSERTAILQSLDGKGAFEDLIRLREALGEVVGRAELLRGKLQHAASLENDKTQLTAEAAELQLRLQQSHDDAEDEIKRATVLVDQAIAALYDDRSGNLIVEASRSGPKFRIDIQGGGNKGGIDMMKLFCFDIALLQIAFARFAPGPRMLVHDSHLFDGVDSRQVGIALAYGDIISRAVGGQYIVALNSDEFEKAVLAVEEPYKALIDEAVNPIRLTDDETGGLFGFRFDMT
ncbi:DUF2326 domain-containing protein [Brevundimonas diminuta]|uniref:ABC-three component system protein n=1 Tax=Brevundimonas diminuta TaxID=293 RepID=UPI002096AD3F|nr:ABC-three component system protein [Brevundimonas diminuta]MCO8019420.1 DUF2326 domain-containing protein [Brevundimonas diminuta]MCO8022098.1 DUF2326 domain-containing protein [Brevundimonas diminuta]